MLDISSTKTMELVNLTLPDLMVLLIQDVKLGKMEFVQFALLDGSSMPMEFVLPSMIFAKLMTTMELVLNVTQDMVLIMEIVNFYQQQLLLMEDVTPGIMESVRLAQRTGSLIIMEFVFP